MAKQYRVYGALRTAIEQRGGAMVFERQGHRYGAWLVELNGKHATFESDGNGFRELDKLYVPKTGITHPAHWSDYSLVLVDGAIDRLLAMLT